MVSGDVGGASGIERLDLNARVAMRAVKAGEDDVWSVLEVCAWALHKLAHRGICARPAIHKDPASAKDRRADGAQGEDNRVVAGA